MRAKEKRELVKSKLKSKEIETLTHAEPMIFNRCKLSLDKDGFGLLIKQKRQGKRLAVIKHDSATRAKEYLEQRARRAYLATICYSEASCALSIAAQHQEPRDKDYKALNKIGFVAILSNKAHLRIPNFLVVVCTDSYSLYECIVKLGTTKEKRLMIDIMAIRESYEKRELSKANTSLQELVLTNTLKVQVDG
ncbi:polyprotein [Drepanopeziza brunnea f. sp. 'multigermtubi' MB_m1]|uniref:Polyprotein n=1 Tax=Marssonina brunnea f. sp. multigermtubi (strain MB_m1) TaxID=1072389 RepID=K1WJH7_MARBU|nr:polyprotein [Drepanopeziza brunnea f. sp. 'multigermtubi' MB_m1]EKD17820.1 polyprotein [Drepanopeziza brunnea f. sp. 'multigermtubi' MB_m1]